MAAWDWVGRRGLAAAAPPATIHWRRGGRTRGHENGEISELSVFLPPRTCALDPKICRNSPPLPFHHPFLIGRRTRVSTREDNKVPRQLLDFTKAPAHALSSLTQHSPLRPPTLLSHSRRSAALLWPCSPEK
jgi:hypothetical protein